MILGIETQQTIYNIMNIFQKNNSIKRKLVPKAGVEPARPEGTTPSRWRVCQFRHFGTRQLKTSINTREKIN